MVENLDMKPRKKTIDCWTRKKKFKRLNATSQEKVNLAVAAEMEQQQYEPKLAGMLPEEKEEHLLNSLKRSGPNQQVVTQEVHQTGPVLTSGRCYDH